MTSLRITLNSGFAGPHAGFFLGDALGHFADEGLSIAWAGGDGAASVLTALFDGSCDAAYGDLACLLPHLARRPPETGPIATFVAFSRTPLTIAVRKDGPVREPSDLAGRSISGHAQDAALVMFPVYAEAAGLDGSGVRIHADGASLGEQVRKMIDEDAADGVFGFVNTIIASLAEAGLGALEGQIRFLEYADLLPDLVGNALIVTPELHARAPDVAERLARASRRGFSAAIADPKAGLAAVAAVNPRLDVGVQLRRWRGTIAKEIDHARQGEAGLGRVDAWRLARGSEAVKRALKLPRAPHVGEIALPHVLLPP